MQNNESAAENYVLERNVMRRRRMLIICLLPIIAIWCFLIVRITPMQVGTAGPNRPIVYQRVVFASKSDQYLTFGHQANRLVALKDLFEDNSVSRVPDHFGIVLNGEHFVRWRLRVHNPQTDNIDQSKEFDLPAHISHPLVIAQRFVVTPKKDLLSIMDVDSKGMLSIEYPAKSVSFDSGCSAPSFWFFVPTCRLMFTGR